jgi:hypothetical protein
MEAEMKPIEEKHSKPITVWVTPGMKRALEDIAHQTGLPVTEIVRNSLNTIRIPKDGLKREDRH